MLRTVVLGAAVALVTTLGVTTTTLADPNPSGTGQPNQECETVRPGHASSARGSAFNPNGVADRHYAGEQPQNSRNPHSVSQYDVACFQVASHQP